MWNQEITPLTVTLCIDLKPTENISRSAVEPVLLHILLKHVIA